jgi:NAD-dependent histone deacetylase SIR2
MQEGCRTGELHTNPLLSTSTTDPQGQTGAGISTSAGIPDFRSPETGLYANLSRLQLPYPEAVFDINFFRQNPLPFYTLARELYPGKYRPTLTHAFIALLAQKTLLHLCVTQNIDTLERRAGVPAEQIVEAHGSFASHRCIECSAPFPGDEMEDCVLAAAIPRCKAEDCGGLVKPDIVFFGEALPPAFGEARRKVADADLCIIMGTSLSVWPFAGLVQVCDDECVRLLINQEQVGGLGGRREDVVWLGGCDDGVKALCKKLGWEQQVNEVWKSVGGEPPAASAAEQEEGQEGEKTVLDDPRTKEEKVEDEVDKLTKEVERGLLISESHEKAVREELEKETRAETSCSSNAALGETMDSKDHEDSEPKLENQVMTQIKGHQAPEEVQESNSTTSVPKEPRTET